MSWGNSPYLFSDPILNEGCKALIDMSLYTFVPNCIKEIPDHLKTQKMCNKAIHIINSDSFFLFPTTLRPKKCVLNP